MFTEPIKRATISKTTSINTERVLDFFHIGGYNMIIKPEKEVRYDRHLHWCNDP